MLKIGAFVLILGMASVAHAEPVAVANDGQVKITLYSDDCRVPVISNFPKRVTWEESGKVFEGCWGGGAGVVAAYFENDKTVAIIPIRAFIKIQNS